MHLVRQFNLTIGSGIQTARLSVAAICLTLASLSAYATDISFNGVKPTVVIDVRTPDEYSAGHIAGAINIPYDQISQQPQLLKGINKDGQVLVYCRSGRRSSIARGALEAQGFSHVIDGGAMTSLVQHIKTCNASSC